MNGRLFGESTGGVMRNYVTDAIGSVVETVSNGTLENTYQYKPYGGTLVKSGTAPDPRYMWNGVSGYRKSGNPLVDYYIRKRSYSSLLGLWSTKDALWPSESVYSYASNSPALVIDPTGLRCTLSNANLNTLTNNSINCTVTLTMASTSFMHVQSANGGWDVFAYLDVRFICTVSCNPCPCPVYGDMPQLNIEQWYYDGAVQQVPHWSIDGNMACGAAVADGCVVNQPGRDTPGVAQSEWDPLFGCDVLFIPAHFTKSELPVSYEIHFVTICDANLGYFSPPPNDPSSLYWGVKVSVSADSPPRTVVTPTSP